ncbi:MAG: hypothetical protein V7K38_11625 [Nostoc sp.]
MEVLTSEAGMGMKSGGGRGAGKEELLINAQCPMPNAPLTAMVFE